jgi:aspartate kinase
MARLVMKFGGTSVADIDRIRNVARHVKREVDAGHEVAVVVSAMSGVTNQLVAWCRECSAMHDAREYDAVVATGELVTAGLLAITLEGMGINARSWQGWQLPILTSNAHASARILPCRFRSRRYFYRGYPYPVPAAHVVSGDAVRHAPGQNISA